MKELTIEKFLETYDNKKSLIHLMRTVLDEIPKEDINERKWQLLYDLLCNSSEYDEELAKRVYYFIHEGQYMAKKTGRKCIEDSKDISVAKVIKAYKYYKTIRKTAKILGMSHPTCSRILREAGVIIGVPGGSFRKETKLGKRKGYSAFIEWVRKNPSTILPRNFKEISKKTNCTEDTVKSYLYRRKNDITEAINSLPDLKTLPVLFICDKADNSICSTYFDDYDYFVDLYSGRITVKAEILNNKITFTSVTLTRLKKLIRNAKEAQKKFKVMW